MRKERRNNECEENKEANEGKKRLVMVEVQEEMVDELLMFKFWGKLSRSQVASRSVAI